MSIQYITKIIEEHEKAMEQDELKLLNDIHYIYEKKLKKIIAKKFHENSEKHEIFITINLISSIYENIKGLYKNLDILEFIAKFLIEKGFKIKGYGKDWRNDYDYVCIYDTRIMDKCERLINKHLEYIDKKINENTKYIKHSIYKNDLYKYNNFYIHNLSKKLLEKYKKSFVVNDNYVINPFYKQECNIL